jgi:hypothetical protein
MQVIDDVCNYCGCQVEDGVCGICEALERAESEVDYEDEY